jgi:hypothetical protein
VAENPWLLKAQQKQNLKNFAASSSTSSADEAASPESRESPPLTSVRESPPLTSVRESPPTLTSDYNKVVITINAEPSVRKGGHRAFSSLAFCQQFLNS